MDGKEQAIGRMCWKELIYSLVDQVYDSEGNRFKGQKHNSKELSFAKFSETIGNPGTKSWYGQAWVSQ